MINCPICNEINNNLTVICRNCGSYLQRKIENINLFETLWLLLENPKKGIKIVAIAKNKNFLFFFSSLFGISLTYLLIEILKLYDYWGKPLLIFISGILIGIPLGFFTLLLVTLLILVLKKIFKLINVNFIQIYTAITFSTTPLIYLLIFLFPVKLIVFGINIFSNNPSPLTINSIIYWIILILKIFFFIYFILLITITMQVLFELKIFKAIIFSFVIIIILSIGYYYFLNYFLNYLLLI